MRLEVIMFENHVLTGYDVFGYPVWAELTGFTMQPVVTVEGSDILCNLQSGGRFETAEAVPLDVFQFRHAMECDYYDSWICQGTK